MITRLHVLLWMFAALLAPLKGQDFPGYALAPGDRLTVRVVGVEEFAGDPLVIDGEGEVNLPLIGRVRAAGLKVGQLESGIAARLKKYVVQPHIIVTVTEFASRPVSVFGAVDRPGEQQLHGPKTLWEVISLAGGLKHEVGDTIRITRRIEYGMIPLPTARLDEARRFSVAEVNARSVMDMSNPEQNIQILPHDVISVSQANVVYVVGHVNKPGGFVANGKLSMLQALALAGGLKSYAAPKKARILRVRAGTDTRFQIPVDLERVMRSEGEDLAMSPDDILLVPDSAWKEFRSNAIATAVAFASAVGIYRVGIP